MLVLLDYSSKLTSNNNSFTILLRITIVQVIVDIQLTLISNHYLQESVCLVAK